MELREAKPPLRQRGGVKAGGIEGGQGPCNDDDHREDNVTAGGAWLPRTTRDRRQGEASRLAELREAKPPLCRRGGVEAGGIEGGQGPRDDDNRREDNVL